MSIIPRRILIIEDHLDSAESMSVLLELAGHQVATAHDGPTAMQTARAFHPELVLCDVGLPGSMDGYAVARAFRADAALRSARLVALTGYSGAESQQRAHAAGFDAHLTKPVDIDALRHALALT